jgi:hypothetical protein
MPGHVRASGGLLGLTAAPPWYKASMEQGRSVLGVLLDLVSRGYVGDASEHDSSEMYAEFQPEARAFGEHELEGLITRFNRLELTLCVDGRVYDVVLREATTYHPTDGVRTGAFVRVHGTWADDGFHASSITRIA